MTSSDSDEVVLSRLGVHRRRHLLPLSSFPDRLSSAVAISASMKTCRLVARGQAARRYSTWRIP